MHIQFKTQKFEHLMLAMGPRDLNSAPYSPVHCSSHSMTSFQSSELTEIPGGGEQPTFRTARAQRTVRPLYRLLVVKLCNLFFGKALVLLPPYSDSLDPPRKAFVKESYTKYSGKVPIQRASARHNTREKGSHRGALDTI